MTGPSDTAKIAFAPHFAVSILDERRILLRSEDRSFLLTGKLYVAAAPYLDGSRTRDEIVSALRSSTGAPPDRVEAAVSTLLARQYAAPILPDVPPPRAAFWMEMAVDPAAAEARVCQTSVAVRALGRGPGADRAAAAGLLAALAEAGFRAVERSVPTDLTIVLVDDYLDAQLDALNREMRRAGHRWMPVKASGRVPWLGPIFEPGDGPCWGCLVKRIGENRPAHALGTDGEAAPSFTRAAFSAAHRLAMDLAVLELVRTTAGVDGAALADSRLVTLDLRDLSLARHLVRRQIACPECGVPRGPAAECPPLRLESRRKLPGADGGSRTVPAEEVLARLSAHVSPITGLVADLDNHSPAEALPVYWARQIFPVAVGPRANRQLGRADAAAGKGATEIQAKVSCLAEAVERYSTGWQGSEPRRRATMAELGAAAVHPNELLGYSERQYAARTAWNATRDDYHWVAEPFRPECPIDWTPTWSLSHERVRWVPTQYCFYRYPGEPEHDFARADSNGCASGSTLEEAIFQGFMELVERDSCALWWYNRVRRPAIDLASFDDPFLRREEAFLRGQGRTLYALDLTSDLGVPVVAALSHEAGGRTIMCGLGAHLDAHVAASRAVAELNQMLILERVERPVSANDRALVRWLGEATIASQPYVVPAPGRPLTAADYPSLETEDLLDDLHRCVAAVKRCGLEMLVLDTTREDVEFSTVRVAVPGLRHFWARFAPGRLYDVPVALGWLPAPLDETELNPTPFFL